MKTIFALTLSLFAFGAFAQIDSTAKSAERSEVVNFAVVETVPLIKGCETISTENHDEMKRCFTTKLFEHVNKHFQFPEAARQLGVGGKVYISFVVEEDGTISNIDIARSAAINYTDSSQEIQNAAKLLDEEAIRIIKMIQIEKPAMQRGKPVRMSFTMPINAQLG